MTENEMQMPSPSTEDVSWAYLLWNSLAIDGEWDLPNVGRYRKTGESELTLIEIWFSRPIHDDFNRSPFDNHHWIMQLADLIGYTVKEEVVRAFDHEVEIFIPDELIGDVFACGKRCGAMLRVEPLQTSGVSYIQIDEDGTCPCCGEKEAIDPELRGVHVVVDDRGWLLKQSKLAAEEEE